MTLKRVAIVAVVLIAAFAFGAGIGEAMTPGSGPWTPAYGWPVWCKHHPKSTNAHCVPTTTTTVATTTTTTTVPVTTTTTEPTTTTTTPASGSAYVISCQPTGDPLNVTLGQPGVDYYPHAYDGSVAGAQAFVDANGGQCWQTYYVGGN